MLETAKDFLLNNTDIHLWEYRMFRTVDAMCTERERRAEIKRQQNPENQKNY